LQRADGVKNQAAEILGIKRTTLIEKLKKRRDD
jgi:DNA-binding NtrC family response regulator